MSEQEDNANGFETEKEIRKRSEEDEREQERIERTEEGFPTERET
jgi:hypothetical protein